MANEQSQSNAHKGNHKLAKRIISFKALTIAIVLFISKIIESFIPFPMRVSNRTRITIHPIMHWCGQIRSS